MPSEKKGLSGPTQLLLAVLALLPLLYVLAGQLSGSSSADGPSPYFMWCPECDLHYYCGPNGIPGMRCPHCARVDATLVFRTRSGTDVWDLVVKLFVGIVAFLAVVVLIVGGHRSKKAAAQPTRV